MRDYATSKGQIIPKYSGGIDDYICSLRLDDTGLLIERDEYMRDKEHLYNIPLRDIISINYINKNAQGKSTRKTIFSNIAGLFLFFFLGSGFFTTRSANVSDILEVSFYNNNKETVRLVFNMMEFGEGGISKLYDRLKL